MTAINAQNSKKKSATDTTSRIDKLENAINKELQNIETMSDEEFFRLLGMMADYEAERRRTERKIHCQVEDDEEYLTGMGVAKYADKAFAFSQSWISAIENCALKMERPTFYHNGENYIPEDYLFDFLVYKNIIAKNAEVICREVGKKDDNIWTYYTAIQMSRVKIKEELNKPEFQGLFKESDEMYYEEIKEEGTIKKIQYNEKSYSEIVYPDTMSDEDVLLLSRKVADYLAKYEITKLKTPHQVDDNEEELTGRGFAKYSDSAFASLQSWISAIENCALKMKRPTFYYNGEIYIPENYLFDFLAYKNIIAENEKVVCREVEKKEDNTWICYTAIQVSKAKIKEEQGRRDEGAKGRKE
jgi:hypothetical protein